MDGMIKKVIGFVKWLSSAERLPATPDEPFPEGSRRASFARWLVRGEDLESAHPQAPPADPRIGFIRWLVVSDVLPAAPEESVSTARRAPNFFRWLVRPDSLPQEAAIAMDQGEPKGFFRWLVSSEQCAQGEPVAPRRRGGSLRWILSPEVCPPDREWVPPRRVGFLRWVASREEL